MPRIGRWLAKLAVGGAALPSLAALAVRARLRPRRRVPALFWGTQPVINIKYHAEAARRQGFPSETVASHVYAINEPEDFDHTTEAFVARSALLRRLPPALGRHLAAFWIFGWAVGRFDIFNYYFDGLVLRDTALAPLELALLRLAGKRTVFMPYGSDVQAIDRVRGLPFKHALMLQGARPWLEARRVRERLDWVSARADLVVSGVDWVDSMPRWDVLTAGHFAIDTALWAPVPRPERRPGEPVVVVHAPNHRELKGTRLLVRACEELRAEGLPLELRLLERQPNEAVRRAIAEADIVADQFVIGWYALFAIEGMSMEKPVLAFLRPDLHELFSLHSFAAECPIVDTPPGAIKERLRELVLDSARRRELGVRGRDYVTRHHSLEAVGAWLAELYRGLWPVESGQ